MSYVERASTGLVVIVTDVNLLLTVRGELMVTLVTEQIRRTHGNGLNSTKITLSTKVRSIIVVSCHDGHFPRRFRKVRK